MGKIPMILTPFFLLVVLGSTIVFLFFPELAEALHYENPQHFFVQHLLAVCLGAGLLFVLHKIKESKWFDIIGATALGVSLFMLTVLLLFPEFSVNGSVLHIGYFAAKPTLLFMVGVLWLVDYMYRYGVGKHRWLLLSFTVVVSLFWVFILAIDESTAMLLGLVILGILFYLHRSFKIFYLMLVSFIGIVIILLLTSPHRISRIQSWIEVITGERDYVPSSGLDYTISKLHDGLFIYNEWSAGVFTLVAGLFTWLMLALWKSNNIFAKSIAILFGVDIILHFIVFMNWSPIKPPSLFIVEYGMSITFVSFLMMGMVLMRLNKSMRQKL